MQVTFTDEANQILENNNQFKERLSAILGALNIAQSCTIEGAHDAPPRIVIRCDGRPPVNIQVDDFSDPRALDRAISRLLGHQSPTATPKSLKEFIASSNYWSLLWKGSALVMIVMAMFFLGQVIFRDNTLKGPDLAKGDYMRGLITILFLVGTLVMVAVVILSTLFADDDTSTVRRVTLAREVLAPLFGVLGTIVGFYFGSQVAERPAPPESPAIVNPLPKQP